MRKKIERRRKCANDIQRAYRGYEGRKRGYAKRMIVAECWRMVGSVSPERKADLEALLPKASYRLTRDEEESVTTITTSSRAAAGDVVY